MVRLHFLNSGLWCVSNAITGEIVAIHYYMHLGVKRDHQQVSKDMFVCLFFSELSIINYQSVPSISNQKTCRNDETINDSRKITSRHK